jgi:DNA-binding transcriptional regulator YiaG
MADNERVDLGISTPCIEWDGARSSNGYGSKWHEGKAQSTHRIAWQEANGPIPDGLCVLHRCDNPPCINIAHLFLGTQADNMHDKEAKGRQTPPPRHVGETHPQAKLTLEQVRSIRSRAAGVTNTELARTYGVSKSTIGLIIKGRKWKESQ